MSMDSDLADINRKFSGTWVLDRSENFEKFLDEMKVNYMQKVAATKSKVTLVIEVKDNNLTVTRKGFLKDSVVTVPFGVVTNLEEGGHKVQTKITYEEGKLVTRNEPQEDDKNPIQSTTVTREINEAGEMVQTMKINAVECKRIFKKK